VSAAKPSRGRLIAELGTKGTTIGCDETLANGDPCTKPATKRVVRHDGSQWGKLCTYHANRHAEMVATRPEFYSTYRYETL